MGLTLYGLREWLAITIVSIGLAIGALYLWWPLVIPVFIVWLALVAFFRDPIRAIPDNLPSGVMLAPSDGVVSKIERVDEHPSTDGPAIVIRVFLSVLDVHVNYVPHDCEVVEIDYYPGKFLNAQTEESARVNEYKLITVKLPNGERFGVRQVAGMIARRIVSPVETGDKLTRGAKFGMIKFGSTSELILPRPDDVRVHVEEGQRVVGRLTLMATLGEPGAKSD